MEGDWRGGAAGKEVGSVSRRLCDNSVWRKTGAAELRGKEVGYASKRLTARLRGWLCDNEVDCVARRLVY